MINRIEGIHLTAAMPRAERRSAAPREVAAIQ
jgi:hypothetical protein